MLLAEYIVFALTCPLGMMRCVWLTPSYCIAYIFRKEQLSGVRNVPASILHVAYCTANVDTHMDVNVPAHVPARINGCELDDTVTVCKLHATKKCSAVMLTITESWRPHERPSFTTVVRWRTRRGTRRTSNTETMLHPTWRSVRALSCEARVNTQRIAMPNVESRIFNRLAALRIHNTQAEL
jgi:hypothetical protein